MTAFCVQSNKKAEGTSYILDGIKRYFHCFIQLSTE